MLHANWCKFITQNENKQDINHNKGLDCINKTEPSANKKRRINNHVQFESVSSEIIDDDISMLNPMNDVPTKLE